MDPHNSRLSFHGGFICLPHFYHEARENAAVAETGWGSRPCSRGSAPAPRASRKHVAPGNCSLRPRPHPSGSPRPLPEVGLWQVPRRSVPIHWGLAHPADHQARPRQLSSKDRGRFPLGLSGEGALLTGRRPPHTTTRDLVPGDLTAGVRRTTGKGRRSGTARDSLPREGLRTTVPEKLPAREGGAGPARDPLLGVLGGLGPMSAEPGQDDASVLPPVPAQPGTSACPWRLALCRRGQTGRPRPHSLTTEAEGVSQAPGPHPRPRGAGRGEAERWFQ